MRKIYFLLTFFFLAGLIFAQVSVVLIPPPPNQLKTSDLWKGMLINTTKTTLHITLSGTLEVAGKGIVIEGRSRMISLPPGTKRITYDDVVSGSVKSIFDRWGNQSGNAPAGDYTIYLLVKAEGGREIGSSSIEQNIVEEKREAIIPQLISPADGSILDLSQPILFTWIVKSNNTGISNFYKLRVVEILGNQSPNEAVKRNPIWYESNELRRPMLQYPLSAKRLEPGKKYAWTVQIINKEAQGVVASSETADAFMFTIDKPIEVTETITPQLITPADGTTLNSNQPVLFTWMAPSLKPDKSIRYKLKVVEILGNQSPSEAVKRNPIWYESNELRRPMLQYPLSAKRLEPGKKYAWTVQIINKEAQGVDASSETADAFMFTIDKPIEVTETITPQLITPADGTTLNSNQPVLFTWMAPSLKPDKSIRYKLKVVEILGNQSPSEAVKRNPIWYESNKLRTLMLQYPLSAKKLEPGKKYAWTVQIIDKETRGVDANSRTADAFMFTVEKTISETETIIPQLISPVNGSTLNSKQPILFTWMLPSIRPNTSNIYKIKLVEIFGKQSPFVAVKQNPAWFEKSDIKATMLQYPISARKLEPGKRYAWTVQLVDSDGQTLGNNTRILEAFIFDVEEQGGTTKSLVNNPPDSTASSGGTGTAAVGDTIRAGLNGEFKVVVLQNTTESDGSLTGNGKVYINWLKTSVAVEFKKITIDTTKRLTSGAIVSSESGSSSTSYQAYPKAWALSLLSGPGVANVVDNSVNWTNDQVESLVNWTVNSYVGYPVIDYQSNIPPPPIPNNALKMPFGLQFNNGNQKLVITELAFKPNESKINFLALEQFSKSGTVYRLGFVGKYFKIHPASIEFANGRVELAEDITIPNTSSNPKMKFIFKKGTANSGSYIEWDNTGVKDISLGLEVKFTRDWLLPVPTSTDSVTATISGNGTSMHDILLSGSLPESEIVGTNGIKVLADSISLDLSDIRNPASMNFPNNYQNGSTVTWQGFYIKSFGLTLPDIWKTGTNPTVVTASNIIIDDLGLTAKIKAVNVFTLQSGRVADLSASLDTVEISIINSSLINGTAKGKLVLPISQVTVQNSLNYKATFAQASGGNTFQIVILPVGPIDADILKGKMTLLPTSNISATISPGSKIFSINLNGTFKWDNPNFSISGSSLSLPGVKMELGFENVGLNYTNNASAKTLAFDPGSWSFASPQKFLANFPISIKKIYYKPLSKVSPELLRGALMIDVVANLTDDIGGETSLGAKFAIEYANKKFEPKFVGITLDNISVHANLSAVKIDGSLAIRSHNNVFGNGFLGTLSVVFTPVGVTASALVEFGNTNHQYSSLYRYWRVEANVMLPPPGVPFLTGIAFRGFGGGAFFNMEATMATSTVTPSGEKFTFTPKKSSLGFRVAATIATTPKEETFNADVGLLAQFSSSQGLTYIAFTGDFWVGAGFSNRNKANINGSVGVSYDFPLKHFNLSANVNVNAPPITTPDSVGLVLDINGKTNKWFFKFGEPGNLNTVNVFGVSLYEYLMFGNDITPPSGFTQTFNSGYYDAMTNNPGPPTTLGVTNLNTKTGKGLALGIGFKFNKNINFNLVGNAYASIALAAGAELNLAFAEYNGLNPKNQGERIGINGWQASGSIGFYASVLASVKNNNWTYNVANIKAGGWLTGRFPNPVYVSGSVQGLVQIGPYKWFGKQRYLVNTSFNRSFEYGDYYSPPSAVEVNSVTQGDAAGDQQQLLIQYVHPTGQQYNFPITFPLSVQFGLIPNNVFDVAEQQSDGSVNTRIFKMVVSASLKIHNVNGSFINQILRRNENNLGEYLYTVYGTVVMSNGSTLNTINNPLLQTNTNTNNTGSPIGVAVGSPNISSGTFSPINTPTLVIYPPPPPTNTYVNLPPEPAAITNNLAVNKNYVFTITATLKEYVNNTSWVVAKNKNNQVVTQTVTKNFRTGPMPILNTQQIK